MKLYNLQINRGKNIAKPKEGKKEKKKVPLS